MRTLLVDTDIIINHLKGHSRMGYRIEQLLAVGTLYVSGITIAEVWEGLSPTKRQPAEEILSQMKMAAVTAELGKHAGILVYNYGEKGITITTADAIIATTAIENNLEVVSHDKVFIKIKELNVYPGK